MKKFLTFLMLLSTLCLSAIAADIEVNRLYHVTCKRGAWTYDGGQMKGATADATDVKQQFAFVLYGGNKYLWSQAAQHFIATDGVAKSILEASPIQWEDLGDGTFRFYFSDDKNINLTQGMVLIDDWNEADDGNIMTLTPVEGFSSSTVLSVLKDDISKKTYTFHITGAPEGSNAKVTYNETQYAGEETVEAVVITPAELTATDIAGYAYSITIDGTNVNVNYTALPFIQGQTYTLTLRGKSLVYDPSTGLMKTDVAATGDDAYFILNGNSADGFTFFSVAANKYFQVQDETADDAKAYAVAETEADATRYDYVGYEGGFTFKIHGTPNNYINERDKAFSTWNSGWGMNDAGGKLTFTIVEEEPTADLPFTVGKKYAVWFNNADKQYFWEDKGGVANEIRCNDGDIANRNELESYSNTVYWTMGGDATNGYTFTNATTGKHILAPSSLSAGAAFLLSDSVATGFDVVKMDNGYYRFYIHGQTTYYLAHTSRNTHLVTMYNVADYGLTENGGASVVQFEEIPDHFDYTLALVDAPAGATVTIGGEARADGAEFTTENRLNTADIAVVAEGYSYSIDITAGVVTITFKKLPITAGKKYVISSVAHANDAVYYLTNDGTNTKLARSTEYPTEDQYWTAESVSVAADGGVNVSFVNNGKYFAFMATTTEAGHAVKLTQDDVDADNFYNVQDKLNYWPDKATETRFLYLAVMDDNTNIGWGSWQGTGIRTTGYSYQFKFDEIAEQYTEGDFYVKNEAGGKYFGFVGTSTSDGNFGPVEEANKLVCTVTQPEDGTFNIQLAGFNYVSCGSNGGFSNNKATNALKLFKVNGTQAEEVNTIEEGAEYLIVGTKNDVTYAISNGTNGKTGADLRTAGIAVSIVKGHIFDIYNSCKWTFEPYVNTDTREALTAVYIKNGEGKYFAIGGEGGDINILDEGQSWNIAPVAGNANAYTLENAELDAVKRFVNSGSHGYTSKGEDYNAKNVYFYELTDAATGTCTLVAQPVLGKTYAMVIKNVNDGYAGYYAIYSGLAKDKIDRGDVIALGTEFPTTLTITEALSSSNGAITPAKALWTLTDTAEEPVGPLEPEYGATITAVFPNGNRHVLYSDGNKLTAAPEGNLPAGAISLFEIVSHEGDNIVLKAGDKYLHWTSGDDANKSADLDGLNEEYDEALNTLSIPQGSTEGLQATTWETTAIASLYELIGNGSNGQAFNFTLRENDDAWIAGNPGMKFFDTNWDGNGCRTSYFEIVLNEEPVGPVEPEFPLTGQPYTIKEKTSGMYLNVISNSVDNKKDVILKKKAQDLYFAAVEGGYTIRTADGLYVGGYSNGWNMSSQVAQTWQIEEVEGGYALKNVDNSLYLGFDNVDNEGAAAYRNKDYAANHGIFEITAYGTAELTAKDKLAAAIEEAKGLNTTDVPEDLVETLQNAIEMAEGVLGDALATDADYDEARGILEHAANAVKNYVPQTPAEMLADLNAAMEQAAVILSANKVEGQLNETTYEYELTSTLAGKVGYKTYDEVFNIAEDIAVLNYYLNLAGNDADALEALLNEVDWSIRMCTAELLDFITAYNNAGWVLPEKGKTYIIRSAPDNYSWTFLHNEGSLTTAQWSTVKEDLTAEYVWTCTGLEDYNIVNSDLEVENLGQRVRFTSLAHPELYLCWKNVTDNAKAGNSYWQISGKNAPLYGAMSMQAFDGSNHYKYLTLQVGAGGAGAVGSMNHGDGTNWVENSAYSSWYFFEEIDPSQFEEPYVGPAKNQLFTASTPERGGWMNVDGSLKGTLEDGANVATDPTDANQLFALVDYNGKTYLWNEGAQHFLNDAGQFVSILAATPIYCTEEAGYEGVCDKTYFFHFSEEKNINLGGSKQIIIDEWNEADAGNKMIINAAEGFNAETVEAVIKADTSLAITTITWTITDGEGNEIATETQTQCEEGKEYTVQFTLYGVELQGETTVTAGKEDQNITLVAEFTGTLPIEYAASLEEVEHWYAMRLHSNQQHWLYSEEGTLAFAAEKATADEYAWALVGDPLRGFQLYNKALCAAAALDAADPCTLSEDGLTTRFYVYPTAEASHATDGFCLKAYGESQYLNYQGNAIKRWGAADAGSTFVFEEIVDIPEGINVLNNDESLGIRFNLQGQRIAKDVRGINIVNRKKLIRK